MTSSLLPPEAFLIPAPYYGSITQHVCLYGGVRLVCVYLDSEVKSSWALPGGQDLPASEFEGGHERKSLLRALGLRLKGEWSLLSARAALVWVPWGSRSPSSGIPGAIVEAKGSPGRPH